MSTIELPRAAFRPNADLLKVGEELLGAIRAGAVTSLALVAIGPTGQMSWTHVGTNAAELCMGAELMRDDLKVAMRGKPGRILRVGG